MGLTVLLLASKLQENLGSVTVRIWVSRMPNPFVLHLGKPRLPEGRGLSSRPLFVR